MPRHSFHIAENRSKSLAIGRFLLLFISFAIIFQYPGRLTDAEPPVKAPHKTDPAVTEVPILMYHQIGTRPTRYRVTPDNFRYSLMQLYKAGYSTISIAEYLAGDLSSLPPGRRPVIITFDDGTRGQINYIETGDLPKLDPDCALAIMLKFARYHPDFGSKAAFFIFLGGLPFGQDEYAADKINLILDLGMEIGNHTQHHRNLQASSNERIGKELIGFQDQLRTIIGPRADRVNVVAFPLGAIPGRRRLQDIFPLVSHESESHEFAAAFGAWGGPAPYPLPEEMRWRIPRIEAHNRLPACIFEPSSRAPVVGNCGL